MCGFLGRVSPDVPSLGTDVLNAARDLLAHRGPDSAGAFTDGPLYLGFRRLAILDLSPSGDQPMCDAPDGAWIVFNGEIYNYVELRAELESKGHAFRTRTDTEVLLALYREHGTEMFSKLNGMFSIALYDTTRRKVVLARDRMGKKPLFYYGTGGRLSFASEIKALRPLPDFPSGVDADALNLYFRLGWVPGSFCIFKGVQKLPPSAWLEFDLPSGVLRGPFRYWSLPAVEYDEGPGEEEWVDRVEEALWEATRIRLRSDVPLGVFLSGGIDSGLIAAAASRHRGPDLQALTIAFPGWPSDESVAARSTADHLGVQSVVRPAGDGVDEPAESVLGHFDEPFSDMSAHPTALVCQTARRELTVVLSGDGGDEVFAGYPHHVKARTWAPLDRIPLPARRLASLGAASLLPGGSRFRRMARRFGRPVAVWGAGCTLDPYAEWRRSHLRPEYLEEEPLGRALAALEDLPPRGTHPLDAAQRFDMRLYMLDDILVKVDRMSMRHSLEVRSPFLDHRVIELALRIPPRFRVRKGANKHLLRRLARRHLPPAVAAAPKQGFGIPLQRWIFEGRARERFRAALLAEDARFPGPLLPGKAEELWREAQRREDLVHPLYALLALKLWQERVA